MKDIVVVGTFCPGFDKMKPIQKRFDVAFGEQIITKKTTDSKLNSQSVVSAKLSRKNRELFVKHMIKTGMIESKIVETAVLEYLARWSE